MKVCIFSRSFPPQVGGLERMAELVAREVAASGHTVEVVTDTLAPDGFDASAPYAVMRSRAFRDRLRSMRRADVILFMNISLVGMLPAIALRRRVVASHQGCYEGSGIKGRTLEFIKRQLTRYVANIACSSYVAAKLPGSSTVVPNAYDDELFAKPEVTTLRDRDFLFCGRLVSDKGCDLLLRSFAVVVSEVSETHLTIIGDGPDRSSAERLADELGIYENVTFTGALHGRLQVKEYWRHRCMVVPSIWEEPFGIVALEGAACCDTVIVTRRGGLPEALGPCGSVVEPTVDALAEAMLVVARGQSEEAFSTVTPCTEDCRRHLARHNPRAVGAQYIQVLESGAR